MKNPKDKPHKEKKFLKIPTYPGGNKAFIKFIAENLQYPDLARKNLIEGTVYLEYTVDNVGKVSDEVILHSPGYGCDEEALRLVRLLKYNPVKNRGVKLKTKMKTRIRFELPDDVKPLPTINVTYVNSSSNDQKPKQPTSQPTKPVTPGYTITFK